MPDGLDVVAVAESPGGALADLLTASRWRIDSGADPAALAEAVPAFLAAESVTRRADDQEGAAGVRLPRRRAEPRRRGRPSLDLVLLHTVPSVRPDDVLTGLAPGRRPGPARQRRC